MSLHAGIDTVAFVSSGLFTKTYGASEQANINSLYVSRGLLEKAPNPLPLLTWIKNTLGKLFKTHLMEF